MLKEKVDKNPSPGKGREILTFACYKTAILN